MAFFGTVKDKEGRYTMGVYTSALQKALRRNKPRLAVFASVKIAEGNGKERMFPGSVWNRLKVCALEDFGVAELFAVSFIKERERLYNRVLEDYRREHPKAGKNGGKPTPVEAFAACPKAKAILIETVLVLCFIPCRSRILSYWTMNATSQVDTKVAFQEQRRLFREEFKAKIEKDTGTLESGSVPQLAVLAMSYKVHQECQLYWKDVKAVLAEVKGRGEHVERLKALLKDCSVTKKDREGSMNMLAMVAALYFPRSLMGTGPKTPFPVGVAVSMFYSRPGSKGKGRLTEEKMKALNLKAYNQWTGKGTTVPPGDTSTETSLFHAIYDAQLGEEGMRELPDYVFDKHTGEGKAKGRGYKHFFEEGAKVFQVAPWCERHDSAQKKEAMNRYLRLKPGQKSASILQEKRDKARKRKGGEKAWKVVKRVKVGRKSGNVTAFLPSYGGIYSGVGKPGRWQLSGQNRGSKNNGIVYNELANNECVNDELANNEFVNDELANNECVNDELANNEFVNDELANNECGGGGINTWEKKCKRDPLPPKKRKSVPKVKRVDQLFREPLLAQTPTAKHKHHSFFAFRKDTPSGGSVFVKGPFSGKQFRQVDDCLFIQKAKQCLDPQEKYLGRTDAREIKAIPVCGFLPERIGSKEIAHISPLRYLVFKDLAGYNPKHRTTRTSKSFGTIPVYDKNKGRVRPIDDDLFHSKSGHAKVALLLNLAFRWSLGINDTCWGNILYKTKRMSASPVYSVDEHQVHTTELKGLLKKPPSKAQKEILSQIIKEHHSTVRRVLEDWIRRIGSIAYSVIPPATYKPALMRKRLKELTNLGKFLERAQVNV